MISCIYQEYLHHQFSTDSPEPLREKCDGLFCLSSIASGLLGVSPKAVKFPPLRDFHCFLFIPIGDSRPRVPGRGRLSAPTSDAFSIYKNPFYDTHGDTGSFFFPKRSYFRAPLDSVDKT